MENNIESYFSFGKATIANNGLQEKITALNKVRMEKLIKYKTVNAEMKELKQYNREYFALFLKALQAMKKK